MYRHNFSDEELQKITDIEKQMLRKFQAVDRKITIEYEGKSFIIFPNVFWPSEDIRALIQNFVINSGEEILDVGTGSGILAVLAASRGAKKVIALDINPAAVENTKANSELHGFAKVIDVRLSDVFNALNDKEKFDVIIANLPLENKVANDIVEKSIWDTKLTTNKKFFGGVKNYLKPNGRVYFTQSNFGAVDEVLSLTENKGFVVKLIGERKMPSGDPRIFYAFELRLKNS